MSTNRLFVYGTLRRDVRGSMFHLLAREASFLGPARARGRLYGLGDYPGFVPTDAAEEWVRGELYRLADPEAALRRLDAYEGCGPEDPAPHEFERIRIDVILDQGEPATAWAYAYRRPVREATRIVSGDYFAEAV